MDCEIVYCFDFDCLAVILFGRFEAKIVTMCVSTVSPGQIIKYKAPEIYNHFNGVKEQIKFWNIRLDRQYFMAKNSSFW